MNGAIHNLMPVIYLTLMYVGLMLAFYIFGPLEPLNLTAIWAGMITPSLLRLSKLKSDKP